MEWVYGEDPRREIEQERVDHDCRDRGLEDRQGLVGHAQGEAADRLEVLEGQRRLVGDRVEPHVDRLAAVG